MGINYKYRRGCDLRYVKYAIIIIIAVIGGIFLGQFITSYETQYLLSREYCGSYRGIDVYRCGEINSDNFVGHAYMLDSAPEELVKYCDAIYFTGGEQSVPIIGKTGGKALGLTQGTIIYITTDTFNADVIYHELFHVYDNAHDNLTKTDEFLMIYYKERDYVSVKAIDEDALPAEFFAAAGAEYLLEPESLKAKAPEIYEYINQRIEYYE